MLNSSQIETFQSQGFLVLRKLIEDEHLERWSNRFEEIATGVRELKGGMKLVKDVMIAKGAVNPRTTLHGVNKILNFESDDVLMSYVRHSSILKAVQSLIGEEISSIVTNVFNKPPEVDGRHPLHQDLRYFRIRPPEKIVATWTAIHPTTRKNGCLTVVPGSHKLGLLEHEKPDWEWVNYKFLGVSKDQLQNRLHVAMEPGDTILFNPLLIHGSGQNRSKDFRRAISAHFASEDCFSPPPDWREGQFVRRIS